MSHVRNISGKKQFSAALAGLVIVTSFLLTGCVPAQGPSFGTDGNTDGATDGTDNGQSDINEELLVGVPAELKQYYTQDVNWEKCGSNECATISAPLDWDNIDGREVELAVVKKVAKGQAKGSLFTNPGGPGGSGFDLVADSANFMFSKELLNNFDLVGWDPRGVGQSTPVKCFADDQAKDQFISFDEVDVDEDDPQYFDKLLRAYDGFIAGCHEYSGDLLANVDTISTVKDLDMMRVLVGDTKLYYLGFSYGAYLGGVYAEQFPDKIGRVVLDGPVDPAVDIAEVGQAQTKGFEVGYLQYLDSCLAGALNSPCPFTGSKDQAISETKTLLASMEKSPLMAKDGRKLWGGSLLLAMITSLYSQDSWDLLSQALTQVKQGTTDMAFLLIDFYNDRNPDGTYNDNSYESSIAINCMDYPSKYEPELWRKQNKELAEVAPIFGPYNGSSGALCSQWPVKPKENRRVITAPGADPILVVGNIYDTATPYEWAVNLADSLESGHLLTREGQGHTSYSIMNRCTRTAVDAYLVDGKMPETGTVCVE